MDTHVIRFTALT